MFGFFEKSKLVKTIKIAVKDIINDSVSANECSEICSNDVSSAWLCTELMIQKLNSLSYVVDKKYSSSYKWATWEFLVQNLIAGIKEASNDGNLPKVLMTGLSRLIEIKGNGRERIHNLYKSSADLILEHDPELNEEEIIEYIGLKVENFMLSMGKYFN